MNNDWKVQLNELPPTQLAAKLADYINARFGDKAAVFEDAVAFNMFGMERVKVE